MRVLITGGNGFLGAWITRRLLARGLSVRIFDMAERRELVETIAGPAAREVEWRIGDIVATADVREAARDCDAIVNLAGVLTPACKADPVRGTLINLIGTLNVFQAALTLAIDRVVYTSSAGVFGSADGRQPFPITHYGASKLACEGSARAYWHDHGLASIGFRPFVVYGPGRETGLTAGATLACRAAVRGERYAIPYSGRAGLVFVDDVAAAYEQAVLRAPDGAHVFNICGETAGNDDVIAAISKLVPAAAITYEGPDIALADNIDDSDLFRAFPQLKRTSLADGIARTIEFYRTQERR